MRNATSKITTQFNNTTVDRDAVDFQLTEDDLYVLAHSYYMERLNYEYESWADGADFEPTSQDSFDYHFAGERLNAIQKIVGDRLMMEAMRSAESTWLHNNTPDSDVWREFKAACFAKL